MATTTSSVSFSQVGNEATNIFDDDLLLISQYKSATQTYDTAKIKARNLAGLSKAKLVDGPTTVYVAPNGSDTNAQKQFELLGSNEAAQYPVKTITAAMSILNRCIAISDKASFVINLEQNTYEYDVMQEVKNLNLDVLLYINGNNSTIKTSSNWNKGTDPEHGMLLIDAKDWVVQDLNFVSNITDNNGYLVSQGICPVGIAVYSSIPSARAIVRNCTFNGFRAAIALTNARCNVVNCTFVGGGAIHMNDSSMATLSGTVNISSASNVASPFSGIFVSSDSHLGIDNGLQLNLSSTVGPGICFTESSNVFFGGVNQRLQITGKPAIMSTQIRVPTEADLANPHWNGTCPNGWDYKSVPDEREAFQTMLGNMHANGEMAYFVENRPNVRYYLQLFDNVASTGMGGNAKWNVTNTAPVPIDKGNRAWHVHTAGEGYTCPGCVNNYTSEGWL